MHLLFTDDVPFFLHTRLLTADREDTHGDNSNYAADHAAEAHGVRAGGERGQFQILMRIGKKM